MASRSRSQVVPLRPLPATTMGSRLLVAEFMGYQGARVGEQKRDLGSEKPRNECSEIGKQVTVSTFGDQIACFDHHPFQDCKSILV